MTEQQAAVELKKKLGDREWRLDNLYYVLNKKGNKVPFKLNFFQKKLYKSMWYLNIILKARQLGFSTFIAIFILDMCLFNSNIKGGIIDVTLPDAVKKLGKIKFAYEHFAEHMPEFATEFKKIRTIAKNNEQELIFDNGSTIYADTTFRGDTLQILHVSEHAKICKKDPIKAKEIRTGALNAVATGQFVFIESTGEDGEGDFYDMCKRAELLHLQGLKLTELDFKFFFFPWWQDPDYALEMPAGFGFSEPSRKYFNALEREHGITLTNDQRFWYVKKKESQDEDMKREFPSTSQEPFEATDEDKYYKDIIINLKVDKQVCEFPIEQGVEIDTDWDLGRSDYTSIIFSQRIGKEIRIVDFFEGQGEALPFYTEVLKRKDYLWGTFYLPHDAANDVLSSEKNILQQMQDVWGMSKVEVVPKLDIDVGINEVRKILPKCWFRTSTTKPLTDHLELYQKKWNEVMGVYTGPKHNQHSHAADAFRYLATRYVEKESIKPKKKHSATSMLRLPRRWR